MCSAEVKTQFMLSIDKVKMIRKDHSLDSGIYDLLKEVSSKDQEGEVQSTFILRCSRYRKSARRDVLK